LARNASCDAVVGLLDLGSTYAAGRIGIYTADSSVITYMDLSNPAFRDSTDGTAISNFIYDSTSFFDATASYFNMLNRDSTVIWNGIISRSDGTGDMRLDSIIMPKDTTVSISSATYAVPA
jgi:hypothetical protein